MQPHDRNRLAVAVHCDPRTVLNWSRDPKSVRPAIAYALTTAAKKLGIDIPETTDADTV